MYLTLTDEHNPSYNIHTTTNINNIYIYNYENIYNVINS